MLEMYGLPISSLGGFNKGIKSRNLSVLVLQHNKPIIMVVAGLSLGNASQPVSIVLGLLQELQLLGEKV